MSLRRLCSPEICNSTNSRCKVPSLAPNYRSSSRESGSRLLFLQAFILIGASKAMPGLHGSKV